MKIILDNINAKIYGDLSPDLHKELDTLMRSLYTEALTVETI